MSLAAIHDADMAAILSDAGNTVTWSGADYPCIVSGRAKTKDLQEGGFLADYDFSLSTRASLFSTLPEAGQTVVIESVTYRIVRTRKNFTGKILVMDLVTAEK